MEYLKWSHQDFVATITIERPPANALSSGLLKELSAVLDEVENNEEIRVILIHGEGRFFSAGADIKEFTTIESGEDFSSLATYGQDLFERMEKFPKPIIAAIHGAALGGGLELAMGCHFRLVAENAKLGLPELQLGLIPGFAGTQRLPRYVGAARAAEMLFTSDPITGLEAVQYGLANHAYPEEQLLDNAYSMAKKIAKKSPGSIKAAIELLNYGKTGQFYEGVKKEAELFGEVFVSEDGKEGISAFIEKREPSFTGK
ncbi:MULTISPECIES: enoyl-CoA hydratase [Cytobacillus]|jgi:enoyl-CoA hydratase|uniref:Enoyl-CoA hydratase n=3 Tax=Cytobacillus TaxID=2675230 RepID=A0A160MEY1_9BACI|nr:MULTISPECIES: enoyl-CoA hydratase [Cytobacillus]EFV77306.1 enoyl-CoA hydratase [Bacillus sp. 2_A_57_CT2]MBY0155294.1 enoyl-CoA hydratase [Cytobacillus firmus]AND41716.1 enoyl-CoA hydratase [Cytobacillus oceanisediminis 2691]MBU8730476.1 enoyl-CoA hydratase [Cytobacillus oceanisediminis]MCM3242470.1 enoyl-CoA hydratase [Cytobacillus oceanisediminis]